MAEVGAHHWRFGAQTSGQFLNVIRPLRFALSAALSPAFDKLISFVQRKTGLGKAKAMGVVVFCVNVIGTSQLI